MSPNASQKQVDAARQRRTRLKWEAEQGKLIRDLITPEGAALKLKLATASSRAGAFLLDVILQWIIVIALAFAIRYTIVQFGGGDLGWGLLLVGIFFIRNFYFIVFEMGRKAATPGKRALGLRVASRNGDRLTANAILARNFIREIEVGLPFQFMLMNMFSEDALSTWLSLLGFIWASVFLFFPVFNKDKLRVGDLIAGTWVIEAPKAVLHKDIAKTAAPIGDHASPFSFTPQQVDAYGIHELHVLEDVLRQGQAEVLPKVAARIRTKISWERLTNETDRAFLEAYYAALRQRLEQRMLMGERKTDKFDT